MLARWISVLNTYGFSIIHRKGMNYGNADGLSRRSCTNAEWADCGVTLQHGCEHESLSPKLQAAAVRSLELKSKPNWMDVWSLKQIREWQVADDEINNILYFKSVSQYPPTSPEVVGKEFRSFLNQWDLLSIENGVLYRHWYEHDSDCESRVIVAPKQLRRELFHHLHELRTGGQLGIKRTVYQLQRRFYWPGLQSDVRTWCRWCVICAKQKPTYGRHRGLLKQSVTTDSMERIDNDILGPLPKTVSGNEYIMVISDYFTKWIECMLCQISRHTLSQTHLLLNFLQGLECHIFCIQIKEEILNLSYFSMFVTYWVFKRRARPHIDLNLMAWLNVLIEQFSKCWHHM